MKLKSEKGQSMVEFALVIPVFILLLFGILDCGRIFNAYLTIDNAAREAARAASIGKDDSTVQSIAVNRGSSIHLTASQVAISPGGEKSSGTPVTIKITYPVDFLTPVIGNIVGPLTLTNTTVMRVE